MNSMGDSKNQKIITGEVFFENGFIAWMQKENKTEYNERQSSREPGGGLKSVDGPTVVGHAHCGNGGLSEYSYQDGIP